MRLIARISLWPVIAVVGASFGIGWLLLHAVSGVVAFLRWFYLVAGGVFRFVFGGFLLGVPGWRSGPKGQGLRLCVFIAQYLAAWGFVWWLMWAGLNERWSESATWLIDSTSGLQTALQVLPATVVAVLVLVLGSLYAIAQLAISSYGSRASVMLTFDEDVREAVARPLLLAAATLLLSGQVPDGALHPSPAVTAAVTTTALATVVMLAQAATLLPAILLRYTLPRGFARYVIEDVEDELVDGSTGLVVMRIGLLGEMLKQGLKRSDSVTVASVLEALSDFQIRYLNALEVEPRVRDHVLEDGMSRKMWLAEDLTHALVSAGQEAIKLFAPERDANDIANALGGMASRFIDHDQSEDALCCIEGLTELGTTSHMITPGGALNYYAIPAEILARVEFKAEEKSDRSVAAQALAGWSLSVSYPTFHFGAPGHPAMEHSIKLFGQSPPWAEAKAIMSSGEWLAKWANKLDSQEGSAPVLAALSEAQGLHAGGNPSHT